MSSTVTLTGQIQVAQVTEGTNAELNYPARAWSNAITMTGNVIDERVLSISTVKETISVNSDLVTLGVAVFENMDDDNFIQVGLDGAGTFYSFSDIQPGEVFAIRLTPGITLQAKANIAAAKLKYTILED